MTTRRLTTRIAYRIAHGPVPYACDERSSYAGPISEEPGPTRAARAHAAPTRAAQARADAPAMLAAVRPTVFHAVTAERAGSYLSILAALLGMRRQHELSPLVDDLARLASAGDGDAFARDLAQLAEWGCVEKQVEPLRIRGYKDSRRERFRFRLTPDALALVEWLEARAEQRLDGRQLDGKDLLTDVLGQARELGRVCEATTDPESPRRALHLLSSIDDGVDAITEELIGFRAQMLGFAASAYDGAALRQILAWLERYVSVHLRAVHELRASVDEMLGALSSERARDTLERYRDVIEDERARMPRSIRGTGSLRDPTAQVGALSLFFGASGRLVELCALTDSSARDVVRKLHGHLRELERQSARRDELGRAIARVRKHEVSAHAALTWLTALMATAHVQTIAVADEGRGAPPLPRRHVRAVASRTPPVLASKSETVVIVRSSRQRRRQELGAWLHERVLGDRESIRASTFEPASSAAGAETSVPGDVADWASARGWIDLARARHLGRGRELSALGVRLTPADGAARVASSTWRMEMEDFVIERDRRAGRMR